MKKILIVFVGMCLVSLSQAAIIAFEAEASSVYYQAGANWTTVTDTAALGGECITPTTNLPDQTDENTRFYSFDMPAGTYHLFVRLNLEVDNGGDDSFYLSNNSLAEDASMTDFNGYTAKDIDGNSMAGEGNFGWIRVHQSWSPSTIRTYVMAADGTAYFKAGPREDGLNVDAFAFVPEADAETVTTAELEEAVMNSHIIQGAATDPVPDSGDDAVDSEIITAVTWTAPSDPNIASVTGYDVVFGTEPNMLLNSVYSVAAESLPVTLAYDTTYYWRVDSYVVWDSNDITGTINDTITGYEWTFATLAQDVVPIVTADDVLTSLELLPAILTGTVDDSGEGDITSVNWEVIGTSAPAEAMQMMTRSGDNMMTNLLEIGISDPNLLMDWIGTDSRNENDKQLGNPFVLTLKGLPADTYSFKSYHHDPDLGDNVNAGMFDVTVIDASGSELTVDVQISDTNDLPITVFVDNTMTSNGTDDIVLVFDLHPYSGLGYNEAWFVMNGFELTSTSGSLYVDFGSTSVAMPGYQAYQAEHEVAETFTEQSYGAFGTTVSVLPTWGGYATVTDTTTDLYSPTATLTTDWPGEYIVQLSATDTLNPDALTGSDTMIVTVAADACVAAQLSGSWSGFSVSDFNEDCVVNLDDLADLAAGWLEDRSLTAQE